MSDVISVIRRVDSIDVSPRFVNYSKVIINVSDDTAIEVGDDSGRVLEIDNPFGTQAMAQSILQSLAGFQYQPYDASGVHLDPAAEIGDAANIRGSYGGIYNRSRKFGRLMKANISAPHDEEIDHEYKYESPTERKFSHQIDDVKASLIIANDRIDASVSQSGGEQSSFGWSLLSDAHRWYANGQEVMSVTASGLKVKGEVEADSGKIGGFNIGASAIWNNISSYGGSQSSGVYVGTDGIQLGQGVFMSPSGKATFTNISADNMTLTGTLKIAGTNITAAALRSGAQSAYNNSSTWSTGAGYGYNYNSATSRTSGSYPNYFRANSIYGGNISTPSLNATSFEFGGSNIIKYNITINARTYTLLGVG